MLVRRNTPAKGVILKCKAIHLQCAKGRICQSVGCEYFNLLSREFPCFHKHFQGSVLHTSAIDLGVVPAHNEVEAWNHQGSAHPSVTKGAVGIERGVRPMAFTIAIDTVCPPCEAIAAEMIGLVVAAANRTLAGDHVCLLPLRTRNGV